MNNERQLSCVECPAGRASNVRQGCPCTFIPRRHAPNRTLYVEGEPATSVWYVKSGAVVLSRAVGGTECVQAVRGPNTFVGLEGVVNGVYRDTARIAGPTTLCGAAREVVDTWLGPETPARTILIHLLDRHCLETPRPTGPALRRVARWLMQDAQAPCLVPRQTVAQLLGLVPETLSRTLADLADDGVISVTRRSVIIRKPEVLAQLADK